MAAPATQNPVVKVESKSAKKKKSKGSSVESEVKGETAQESTASNAAPESSNGDGSYESPYIKELYKSIRNVNKKITNASRVDNIIAENPDMSLDELVAARKINADQKAQILKKPQLQASLLQLEEQIAQYKKFDQEYKARSQAEKAEFEKTFTDRANKEQDEAVAAAKAEAEATLAAAEAAAKDDLNYHLLTVTQFLKLAAIRRSEEEKAELEESKALEGLLADVYSGDDNAVEHMKKLVSGSTDTVKYLGEPLNVTYADLKTALAELPPTVPIESEATNEEAIEEHTEILLPPSSEEPLVMSDPTIVNAGLTELDSLPVTDQVIPASDLEHLTNGHSGSTWETQGIPQNSGFGEGANAAAEANWDNSNDLSTSQEWVEVPRDAAETETGLSATPAAAANVQSWADDQPETSGEATTAAPPTNNNEGFQEITRNRGGRGSFRGGRGRGDGFYRGSRGGRGDGYRGRGRGGGGGGRGGARRPEES